MRWRTIYTDSESLTGVAPECLEQNHLEHMEDDPTGVYDCCPGPQLETYGEDIARQLAELLTQADAQPCL